MCQNLQRHFVLHDVVGAGAAAADIGAAHFLEDDAGNGGEQLARCAADTLAVARWQASWYVTTRSTAPICRFSSMDARNSVMSRTGRELLCGGCVSRIAGEQLAIFLEHRATAGGVADDSVERAAAEGIDIAARQPARVIGEPE